MDLVGRCTTSDTRPRQIYKLYSANFDIYIPTRYTARNMQMEERLSVKIQKIVDDFHHLPSSLLREVNKTYRKCYASVFSCAKISLESLVSIF